MGQVFHSFTNASGVFPEHKGGGKHSPDGSNCSFHSLCSISSQCPGEGLAFVAQTILPGVEIQVQVDQGIPQEDGEGGGFSVASLIPDSEMTKEISAAFVIPHSWNFGI